MFCGNCGKELSENVQFCWNCGRAVTVAAVQAAVVPIEKKCASCGTVLKDEAKFCPNCGCAVTATKQIMFCKGCGKELSENAQFCGNCGTRIDGVSPSPVSLPPVYNQTVNVPPSYNVWQASVERANYRPGYTPKKRMTALLLCLFTAVGHRFYTGKIGTAIVMTLVVLSYSISSIVLQETGDDAIAVLFLISLVSYLIWWIIDLVMIINGKFRDKQGNPLIKA